MAECPRVDCSELGGPSPRREIGQVLLVQHVAVHCKSTSKQFLSLAQEHPILQTRPVDEGYGFNCMAGLIAAKAPVEVLVQEDIHSSGLEEFLARLLQHRDHLLPPYTGKPFEEIANRTARRQMLE